MTLTATFDQKREFDAVSGSLVEPICTDFARAALVGDPHRVVHGRGGVHVEVVVRQRAREQTLRSQTAGQNAQQTRGRERG